MVQVHRALNVHGMSTKNNYAKRISEKRYIIRKTFSEEITKIATRKIGEA